MSPLINEADRAQPIAGTSIVATPVLGGYKLDADPARWSPEEHHEYQAAVAMAGPVPANPAHGALRERENRARTEERLSHKRRDRQIAESHAASIGASWDDSIHRHVVALLALFADPHLPRDVARNLVLDQLRIALADAAVQLWP